MPSTAGETDGEKLARMGTDAALWAAEMATALTVRHGGDGPIQCKPNPVPGGLLHAWLCNAIEAGRSAGYAQGRSDALKALVYGRDLPADPAGSQPADVAGKTLPADPAGRSVAAGIEDVAVVLGEICTLLAQVISPEHGLQVNIG